MPAKTTSSRATSNGHAKRVIDYNQIKAARAEVSREPVVLKIGGETVKLPAELPARVSFLVADGQVMQAVDLLLGDKANLFWDESPSMDDVNSFFDKVADEYGLGEAGE